MADTGQENQTSLTQFILLGFGTLPKLQPLLFLLFLVIYLVTMAGNLLVVVLVVADWHLHTPMYFFLGNLSCLEICYSSAILPRLLAGLLMGDKTISVGGCITQFFFSGFFVATECYLLAMMSYDRYLAICKPLHYATRMCSNFCLQLAAGSWINGILAVTIIISLMSQLTFCGSDEIDHFFCEATQLIKHFCKDMYHLNLIINIVTALLTLPPFVLTVTSYVCIISTVLRIPSTTGRQKAFSTCSSHLTMVTIFYGILMVVYLLPKSNTLRDLDKVFSICYTFLTPLANPLIYSLRNTELKGALRKLVRKCAGFSRIQ